VGRETVGHDLGGTELVTADQDVDMRRWSTKKSTRPSKERR
jgi:hypothetical protein